MSKWIKEEGLFWILGLAALAYLGILGYQVWNLPISSDLARWDHFGSAIGGGLGTLISLVVLILVFRTYKLQKEELKELRTSAQVQNQIATSSYAFNLVEDTLSCIKSDQDMLRSFSKAFNIDKMQWSNGYKVIAVNNSNSSELYFSNEVFDYFERNHIEILYELADHTFVISEMLPKYDYGAEHLINCYWRRCFGLDRSDFNRIKNHNVLISLNHLITLGELLNSIKPAIDEAHYRFLIRKVQLFLGDDLCRALLIHSELDCGLQPKPDPASCFWDILRVPPTA